ncbi:esterase [Neisseria arctica]|uniref:Esterase n=1 Tax=Neisseria arctica TaxID=1470200 RepID=A0A0J0YSS3_9NEIS|nr:thioesterase family protein [Neisseria arctica]KLT73200.1 esterase [Neisseria arctica]UOO87065.1 thioesterase family protein [Neisseria arctica]
MPRITVEIPQKILFSTNITIAIGDINYGNHLSNDAVLRLCHEARIRWLKHHQLGEIDIGGGNGLIMADTAIQYTAQAHHGDELSIQIGISDIFRCGFTLLYHLYRPSDQTTIARVQTGMVCFSYNTQKVNSIPESFKILLTPTESK